MINPFKSFLTHGPHGHMDRVQHRLIKMIIKTCLKELKKKRVTCLKVNQAKPVKMGTLSRVLK